MSSTSSTNSTALSSYLNTVSSYGNPNQTVMTLNGLSSGINTTAIVNEMMSLYAQPQALLSAQLVTVQQNINLYGGLSNDFTQLQTAADAISLPSDWQSWQATSSSTAVTATAGTGAVGGAATFSVNSLAQAASLISAGAVTSTSATVTSGNLLLAQGGTALGFATFADAGQSLALGNHTISVTQASSGASQSGSGALGATTTITAGTNDTIAYTLDGANKSLTIAAGSYSASQLAGAITTASGGDLTATIGNSGNLVLTTNAEGSSHSLAIGSGDANATLGLSSGGTSTGTDGVVSVDGTSVTLNDIRAGQPVTLADGKGGSINATFSGGLRLGSVTATEVSTGNGSLAEVASAINGAGLGFTASAVQTGTNSYKLQLLSSSTGTNSTINVDAGAFSGIGQLETLTAGSNADITVGQGAGQFDLQSQTNTIKGIMPGVTLTLNSTTPPGSPVTVSLSPNAAGMAAQVQNLVSVANTVLTDIASTINYNATTGQAGPLMGDSTVTNLYDQLLAGISGSGGFGSPSAANAGITMNADGTISFNQTTFEAAFQANPSSVSAMFTGGNGTSTNPAMSVVDSSDNTAPGTYDVSVTQAATQAATTLDNSTAHTFAFTSGTATASYTSTSGQSATSLAAALNSTFGSTGLGLTASVVNGAVQVNTMAYGSAASFGLAVDGGASQTYSGTDVAGTIDGQAATGAGQLLVGSSGSVTGLILQVTGSQTGNLGSVTYAPGLAGALGHVANNAVDPLRGALPRGILIQQQEVSSLQASIAAWNPVLAEKQTLLQQEWSNMETAMAGLKSTQQQLGFSATSGTSGG